MALYTVLAIAVGLAMDAFAVAIATGVAVKRDHLREAIRMAAFFGLFQALMPALGWVAGLRLRDLIHSFDHWVAFGLLALVGGKMLYEALWLEKDAQEEEDPSGSRNGLATLLLLSVATSIDALAVGLSLSVLGVEIILPSVVIGVVTFALTFAGVFIGCKVGHLFEKKIEAAGGLVLIGIGIKILVDHFQGG